ncbi:MAG: hypothetical protein HYZ43_15355 [Flavobacteriia bacterium]|nr:hypothetical protein [Flavobacteriia bacterium]
MKRLIVMIFLLPLLVACSSDSKEENEDTLKTFRENGYNFSGYKKQGYKNIRFKLPKSFEFDYGNRYCYKPSSLNRRDYSLGVIFTIERFTEDDLESELMEDFYLIDEDLLNSFHDAYADRRFESLTDASISFKKDTKKNIKFKGVTQTLSGKGSSYSDEVYYAMATLKVRKEYYVFQFISKREMMDYVYDDFERILATVRHK